MTDPVDDKMKTLIRAKLDEIAGEEGVQILLAVESGSRAWGFHSPDSDYDVRFIYARPIDWHLNLGKKRDVIERPIDDELDISGWELSKALTLALGSNAVIAEWLQSPVVYSADDMAVRGLSDFASDALDRKSVSWHYLSLLRRQEARLIGPDGRPRLKRFFYILRPTLALRWMRVNDLAMPPMDMARLRSGCDLDHVTEAAIDHLIAEKMAAPESATSHDPDPILTDLIAAETGLAERWLASASAAEKRPLYARADALHRDLTLSRFPL
ncbi:nucleotidyltransferase domain-containing protein [uncultured Mameliella sp.]|uniref:nucleotidyltransferase domain-containing protein n=1 Tax=uncultured Mameliella sp. TaxID=1447087 RepID=UPI00260F1C8E|nr:nucleotidyltransferase domain-containing protein [uncultured Mameliella sp.]